MKKSTGKLSKGLSRLVRKKKSTHFEKTQEINFSEAERINYFRMFNGLQTVAS